jgi:hypothetical protein
MSDNHIDREPPQRPQTYMALPGRIADHAASFHRCLADLLKLAGADVAPDDGTRTWRSVARRVIWQE